MNEYKLDFESYLRANLAAGLDYPEARKLAYKSLTDIDQLIDNNEEDFSISERRKIFLFLKVGE